jgi:hypothetical protein
LKALASESRTDEAADQQHPGGGRNRQWRWPRASYERCSAAPNFFRSFYNDFFARCPEAERRFANTDFEHQIRLLGHVRLLLRFPPLPRAELSLVSRLAEHHSRRDLDVPPRLYPLFVDSLMATMRHYDI